MSQNILLPNFNLSLLQSQKHNTNNKLKVNKINISTEIVPSKEQNSFEIKLVVDSPFGQLQISNNIFIKGRDECPISLTTLPYQECKVSPAALEAPCPEQIDYSAIHQFLDIYAKSHSQSFIRNSQASNTDINEELEDEEKSKSTAPNSPNQGKYSLSSTSNSPASTETVLDDFQVENVNLDFAEGEDGSKCDHTRGKSQTILTSSSMSTTSLILEDDSEGDFNNSNIDGDDVQSTFIRSEKKNSVKNVLKAFGNYILSMNEGQDDEIIEISSFKSADDLKKRYLRYNKNQNYNNSLVCKIIQHQQYGIIFKHFINFYAGTWLLRSDVGDKASHETFINFCKSACEDHELLNCLKIIKKKHLKLSSC